MVEHDSQSPLDSERPAIESLGEITPIIQRFASVSAEVFSAEAVRELPYLLVAASSLDTEDVPFIRHEINANGLLTEWYVNHTRYGINPVDVAEFRAVIAERNARMMAAVQGFGETEIFKAGVIAYHLSKPQRQFR